MDDDTISQEHTHRRPFLVVKHFTQIITTIIGHEKMGMHVVNSITRHPSQIALDLHVKYAISQATLP